MYGSTGDRWEVFSTVRRARLTVQNAPAAKIAGGLGIVERQSEAPCPQPLGSHSGENFPEALAFLVGLLHFFRIRLDKLLRHAQPFDGELAGLDGYERGALHRAAMPGFGGECEVVPANRVVEVDTQQSSLNVLGVLNIFAGTILPEGECAAGPLRLELIQRGGGTDLQTQQAPLHRVCRSEAQLDIFSTRICRPLGACRNRKSHQKRGHDRRAKRYADGYAEPHTISASAGNNIRYKG